MFVIFILATFTAFALFFLNYTQTMDYLSENPDMGGNWYVMPSYAIRAFVEALASAALLFLGSALLYRADKWLESAE